MTNGMHFVLALSFEREERTASVTDFMRDFGILGTERLRPTADNQRDLRVRHLCCAGGFAIGTRVGSPRAEHRTGHTGCGRRSAVLECRYLDRLAIAFTSRRKTPLRTALLGMLLAGLAAWSYFGQPEEQFVNAIGYVDETLDLGLSGSGDEFVDVWTADRGISIVDSPVIEPAASTETAFSKTKRVLLSRKPRIRLRTVLWQQRK